MFSNKIIDTDVFLEMPISTQLLYFHLCMRADDDGFVANPKKIMKITGCGTDDIKILFAKRYLLPFETGVCVIKHWLIHNQIRKDRHNETTYLTEKNTLGINDFGAYTEKEKNGCQNGNQMATQVRLGKVSKGKVSIDKESKDKYKEFENKLLLMWQSLCDSFPKISNITVISQTRRSHIKQRFEEKVMVDRMDEIFKFISESEFLTNGSTGGKHDNWRISFDWLIGNDNNYLKVLEGKYKGEPKVRVFR